MVGPPKKSLPKAKGTAVAKPISEASSSVAEPKAEVIVPTGRVVPTKAATSLEEGVPELPFEVPELGSFADSPSVHVG